MRSPTSSRALLLAALVGLAACARSAPELPPDSGSTHATESLQMEQLEPAEAAASCTEIANSLSRNKREADALEAQIAGNRGQNQATAYIGGVLFLPALLATEGDYDAKDGLDRLQRERDRLIALKRLKSCG